MSIIKNTIEKIKNREVEANRITKTVLVIDEAQDMNEDEFELINTLMEQNEEMRVIWLEMMTKIFMNSGEQIQNTWKSSSQESVQT